MHGYTSVLELLEGLLQKSIGVSHLVSSLFNEILGILGVTSARSLLLYPR